MSKKTLIILLNIIVIFLSFYIIYDPIGHEFSKNVLRIIQDKPFILSARDILFALMGIIGIIKAFGGNGWLFMNFFSIGFIGSKLFELLQWNSFYAENLLLSSLMLISSIIILLLTNITSTMKTLGIKRPKYYYLFQLGILAGAFILNYFLYNIFILQYR